MTRAQQMAVATRFGTRDPFAFAGRRCGAAIKALRHLERDQRTPGHDAQEEPAVEIGSFFLQNADIDGDACIAQQRNAASVHTLVRVLDGHDDAREAGCDQRICTRRRLSVMRTGFERDISRCAARTRARRL